MRYTTLKPGPSTLSCPSWIAVERALDFRIGQFAVDAGHTTVDRCRESCRRYLRAEGRCIAQQEGCLAVDREAVQITAPPTVLSFSPPTMEPRIVNWFFLGNEGEEPLAGGALPRLLIAESTTSQMTLLRERDIRPYLTKPLRGTLRRVQGLSVTRRVAVDSELPSGRKLGACANPSTCCHRV